MQEPGCWEGGSLPLRSEVRPGETSRGGKAVSPNDKVPFQLTPVPSRYWQRPRGLALCRHHLEMLPSASPLGYRTSGTTHR